MTQPPIPPAGSLYPYLFPNLELTIEGRLLDGGRVNLFDPQFGLDLTFKLPISPFGLMALVAARDLAVYRLHQPASQAFATKAELLAQFAALHGVDDPQIINKYAFFVRERLEATVAAARKPNAAAYRRLLESDNLGTRLSLPPQNLTLILLDADRMPKDFWYGGGW